MKAFIRSILGDERLGVLDYYRHPQYRNYGGGPFNGQEFRRQIFLELIGNISFSAIVETGTYLGTTTDYLHASSRLPVFTAERNDRYFGFAKTRFRSNRNITMAHEDSRLFLRRLVSDPKFRQQHVFFYLDAHWERDLPLREELVIILETLQDAVVMVDDFKVPGDDGYGYDSYGEGKVLDLEYLAPIRSQLNLAAFFPARKSGEESGQKRGCVLLARDPGPAVSLRSMTTIKEYRE
jgi:hypothetical protein